MSTNHRQLKMGDFTMEELGVFVTLCMASCGGLLAIVWRSRCKRIKTCCFECDREVEGLPPKKDLSKLPLPLHQEKEPLKETSQQPTPSPSLSTDVASPTSA